MAPAAQPRDVVTLAVMTNRMEGVVRKMTNTLFRTARSSVLNTARDFSCCIVTANHEMLVMAESLPIHVISRARRDQPLADASSIRDRGAATRSSTTRPTTATRTRAITASSCRCSTTRDGSARRRSSRRTWPTSATPNRRR